MADKSAIVTGATRGLGFELALKLADEGYAVTGVARNPPKELRWKEFSGRGSLNFVAGDVGEPGSAINAFNEADKNGPLDLVINCAGVGVFGAAGNFNIRDIENVLRGNLIGTILFSDAAYNRFKVTGGTIVNVMSTASNIGRANETLYCASKWGAKGYTEALRAEGKGTPVKIISVFPGGMRTDFWALAQGSKVDPRTFMDPKEVAAIILNAIDPKNGAYVSDIIINKI
jgi:short-subunit dehydrogenase